MKFLGFYPETAAARIRAAAVRPRVPTLADSLGLGVPGFCLICTVVFAATALSEKWLKEAVGEGGSYVLWAFLIILPAGGLFSRLIIQPAPLVRFYLLFAGAFVLYSVAWTTGYFLLRNQAGAWFGSLLATTALGLTLGTAFDAPRQTVKVIMVLFVTRSAGYFGGEFLQHALPGIMGRVLSGAAYGLGLGAGLSYTLYACQQPVRELLKTMTLTGGATTSRR
jgi:hypothetical protein